MVRYLILILVIAAGFARLAASEPVEAIVAKKLLGMDQTLVIDMAAPAQEAVVHPQALRWGRISETGHLVAELPRDIERVLLLGDVTYGHIDLAERALIDFYDRDLPVFHFDGPASAIVTDPADQLARRTEERQDEEG
jgi:hypothetical protein